jgi:DTW domain-containing protein YfiP
MCICAELPRVANRTRIVLLVHQLERNKTTNTGLLAARCLENVAVVYHGRPPLPGQGVWPSGVSSAALSTVLPAGQPSYLLYPHQDAVSLDVLAADAATRASLTLVIPDGTWTQAARMRARSELPCVTLPPVNAAARRMRTPTDPRRLATLEAVAFALGLLEGPAIEQPLMRLFRTFTERTLWVNGRIDASAVTGGVPNAAPDAVPDGATGEVPDAAPDAPANAASTAADSDDGPGLTR